ncbi:MAG: hypothetical protein PHU44_15350 [Syntrophales bacterium]|nr:hypothetical protein [Syntrophales bacterium]MDD5640712.1 hypothetical protein [Syntrophales bacterium]
MDKALEALKFHIKKEIVDNYFADRVYLEEDLELLREETATYRQGVELVSTRFLAFYQALGPEPALDAILDLLGMKEPPFYQQFQELGAAVRRDLLRPYRRRGWTAARCYRYLVYDVYEQLQAETAKLREEYEKLNTHLRLLNEDIDKFNLSYDFGLIAAQMEALEGRQEVLSGGLMSGEREELSTRMRFKRQKLTLEDLPPLPVLPRLKEIRSKLEPVLARYCQL